MSEGLDNFSTVVTTLATIGAVCIAWMGLSTWKAQIKWQTDHDLARRLLVEIYRFRDAVGAARSPYVFAHEMRDDDKTENSGIRTPDESNAGMRRAFQRRFSEIGSNAPQLYALLLEAEAVWGPQLSAIWRDVNRLQNELSSATSLYLDYLESQGKGVDPTVFYPDKAAQMAARKIIYSNGESDGKNEFSNRIKAAISRLEDYLRPKLGRPNQ